MNSCKTRKSSQKEIHCCEGCGRDTTSKDMLCKRCSPKRHTAPQKAGVLIGGRVWQEPVDLENE